MGISIVVLGGAERTAYDSEPRQALMSNAERVAYESKPRQALMSNKVLALLRSRRISQLTSMISKVPNFTENHHFWHLDGEAVTKNTLALWEKNLKSTKQLGEGNFGTVVQYQVLCAREGNESKYIAMKTVSLADPHYEEEAEALQKINQLTPSKDSPYLMQFIGGIKDETEAYFLTSAYNSDTLFDATRAFESPFTVWAQRLAFILDAAKGLRELHRADLVHADLKPENIMIHCDKRCVDIRMVEADKRAGETDCTISERNCFAVLIDVGLAVEAGTAADLRGTPGFVPPECVQAKPVWEKSADIWSLGALVYEQRTDEILIPENNWQAETKIQAQRYFRG